MQTEALRVAVLEREELVDKHRRLLRPVAIEQSHDAGRLAYGEQLGDYRVRLSGLL